MKSHCQKDSKARVTTGNPQENSFTLTLKHRCLTFTVCLFGALLTSAKGFDLNEFSHIPADQSQNISSFYMGKYEVTWALWNEVRTWGLANGFTDLSGGGGKANDHPAHSMNWYDAVKWCNARSAKENLVPCYTVSGAIYKTGNSLPICDMGASGYRLPTGAEWLKAARCGSTQRFPWGDTISHTVANFRNIGGEAYQTGSEGYHPIWEVGNTPYTAPVTSFTKNGYQLYNMIGNVQEFCWDNPSGTTQHSYGGSWFNKAMHCVPEQFGYDDASRGWDYVGFRLASSGQPDFLVKIEEGTAWITDTRDASVAGHDRKQYFKGQTMRFPFKIRNDGTTNVDAKVYLIPAQKTGNSTHSTAVWPVAPKIVTLNASSETPVTFDVPVPANAEFGFYDVKAIVELASDSTVVLDTTEDGANNTNRDSDAAWIGDSLVFGADGFCAGRADGGTTSPLYWEAPLDKSFMVCRNEPVVLVPGMGGDPSGYYLLPYYLTQRQKYAVIVYSYTNTTNETSARQIAADLFDSHLTQWSGGPPNAVEARRRIADARSFLGLTVNAPVKIIAHSFGGVISRVYMDGFAQHTIGDPATNVPFTDDIDVIVTMASPLWGSYDGAFISDIFIAPNSGRQKDECAIGSDLLWGMNPDGGNIRQNHFAFGVAGDEVVDVVSATATNLAGHSFVITKPGGGAIWDHLKVVNVDSPSHAGYLCMSAALDHGSPVGDFVTPYTDWNGNKGAYLFYRIYNQAVEEVPSWVRCGLFDPLISTKFPMTRGRILSASTSEIHVEANGIGTVHYADATKPLSLSAGTLHKEIVLLTSAGDADADGLSDDFERKWWGVAESPEVGSGDADKDGWSNWWEQILGTNPKEGTSNLRTTGWAPVPKADGMEVAIPLETVPGVTYRFQWVTQLGATWETVETFVGDGSVHQFKRSGITNPSAFFRFSLEVP